MVVEVSPRSTKAAAQLCETRRSSAVRRAVAISALYQKWQKLPQMVSAGQPTLSSIPETSCSTAFLRFRSVLRMLPR